MTSALTLPFDRPRPPAVEGIELLLGPVELALERQLALVLDEGIPAELVHADPPWSTYERGSAHIKPQNLYPTLTNEEIASHLVTAGKRAPTGARLVLWHCWPLLVEVIADPAHALRDLSPWRWKTGGAWGKVDHQGVGYHWLGRSEPVLVLVKPGGSPRSNRQADLGNLHLSRPSGHSTKPQDWLEAMLRRWTEPGDLVLDLYAGLGSMARAARRTGRRYVGAELDPYRHEAALCRLAQVGSSPDG